MTDAIAQRYRTFADQQTVGVSPSFETWARALADDAEALALLARLPRGKQQPNLVFAAARLHGAVPGDPASLHATLTGEWDAVSATIQKRSTQTNEAARCAAILLGLNRIDGPVALLEVGASAGLCLVPDRYSYDFSDGSRLDPADGPSVLTIPIGVDGVDPPRRMPEIVWRAGLDLNPLDPSDVDDVAWLDALVWPEQDDRRARLRVATGIAARGGVEVRRGDLLRDLAAVADGAPTGATLVVLHSATLAYLDAAQRKQAVEAVAAVGAHRLSLEGRGIDPAVPSIDAPTTPATLFVAALDGEPYALTDGHGSRLVGLPGR